MDNIIDLEFPISAQISYTDKQVLLTIREMLRTMPSYSYLEIGSYLGGSLTPFLKDPNCAKILSVDKRGQQQPDERGAKYDYSGITHQTMIENLQSHGFDTSKIETFDGSINQYTTHDILYDFIFIDGEHTNWACFRDFVHSEQFLKHDCIVAFHDTTIIYQSIQMINELLQARRANFKFIKVENSEISCLFFNKFAEYNVEQLFTPVVNIQEYYKNCENYVLMSVINNRIGSGHTLKDAPILPA